MTTRTDASPAIRAQLYRIGVQVSWSVDADQGPPPWAKGAHGVRYRVTIGRGERRTSFPYWDSLYAKEHGEVPTLYDIASCIVAEAQSETDPDEVYAEYGPMEPSRCIAIAEHSRMLGKYLSAEDCETLREAGAE